MSIRRTLTLVTLLAAWSVATFAAQGKDQDKIDVTGTWIMQVETSAGSGTPTFTFKQDGEKLTGTYKGQLGEAEVKGELKGNAITFSFTGDAQGLTFTVVYTGTVEKDTMKGTVDLGGQAEGTFTGKRQ